jgi:hypothetical protein
MADDAPPPVPEKPPRVRRGNPNPVKKFVKGDPRLQVGARTRKKRILPELPKYEATDLHGALVAASPHAVAILLDVAQNGERDGDRVRAAVAILSKVIPDATNEKGEEEKTSVMDELAALVRARPPDATG